MDFKVHIFSKFSKSSPYFWLALLKTKVKISQNFVAFSEYMNFKVHNKITGLMDVLVMPTNKTSIRNLLLGMNFSKTWQIWMQLLPLKFMNYNPINSNICHFEKVILRTFKASLTWLFTISFYNLKCNLIYFLTFPANF